MLRARLGQVIDPNVNRELVIQSRRARMPGANALSVQPEVTISLSPQVPGFGEDFSVIGKATFDGLPLLDHKVSLLVDGVAIGTAVMGLSGYSFKTSISEFGTHVIQASVQMSLLRQKNSAQVSLAVAPVVSIQTGQNSTSSQVSVTVSVADQTSGNPVSTPYSYVISNPDGTQLTQGNGSTDNGGNDTFEFTPQQIGTYQVTVDVGGVQSIQSVSVTQLGNQNPPPNGGTPSPAAQPLALQASINPIGGSSPVNATISAIASGGAAPYSYKYQFDDNGSGDTGWLAGQASASHQYANPGTYIGTVTVQDSKGLQMAQQVTITVTQGKTPNPCTVNNLGSAQCPPNSLAGVSVVANPQTGQAPLSVQLTVTVVGGTPGKVQYTFHWADGTPDLADVTLAVQTHVFAAKGNFQVQITAFDPVSNTTVSTSVNVVVSGQPSIIPLVGGSVTYAGSPSPTVPATLVFTAVPQGGVAPFSFVWNFGDGSPVQTSQSPTISHEFTSPGTFNVSCKITDSQGQSYTVTTPIGINPAAPVPPPQLNDVYLAWYYGSVPAFNSGYIQGSVTAVSTRSDITIAGDLQVQIFDDTGKVVQVENFSQSIPPKGQVFAPVWYLVGSPGATYRVMAKFFDSSGEDIGNTDLSLQVQT